MGRFAIAALVALTGMASAASDYNRHETSPRLDTHLCVPAAAMAIAPLRNAILARYDEDKKNATADADYHTNVLDETWRVTFESPAVLSLSDEIFADEGGAHPNGAFDAIVWDKRAGRAVPITAFFVPEKSRAALQAIAAAVRKNWAAIMAKRTGTTPGDVDMQQTNETITGDAAHLSHYALTYAKGESHANGMVFLYGAGEVWPHVVGDFRVGVPASVFAAYLKPRWRATFGK
jgi:hypothetical protein